MEGWDIKPVDDSQIYKELVYIDSLDDIEDKAKLLQAWTTNYLTSKESFNLEYKDLNSLSELLFKNIRFLNNYKDTLENSINEVPLLKKFYN